ncbi:MAG TPA: hypothetical protein VHA09_05930 [Nitrososphaera sp.]|nr:hypothetical protein [Nitrososphaera sp.]
MSQIDGTKKVYVIVHGQRNLVEPVKEKLAAAGFKNTEMASLDKAGNTGEYVAMLWPPMAANEIMVSVITGPAAEGGSSGRGMGAWGSVATKEVMRLPLK